MLFLLKIYRIQKVYLYFQRLKEEEGELKSKQGIRIGYCNQILRERKFEKYRKERLLQIKDNLALLVIKIYFKSNQLNFPNIMKRIKRYKRKLKMCASSSVHNEKAFDAYSTRDISTRSEVYTNNSSNENLRNPDNLGNILECASLTSTEFLQIEQTRKEKIQNGIISYNIAKPKEIIAVLPYLYQKDIQEEVSPQCHYTIATTSLISRMLSSNPQRHNPRKKSLPLPAIQSPPKPSPPKKLVFTNERLPNFTRATFSSDRSPRAENNEQDRIVVKNSPREKTTLFNQTITTMQKAVIKKKRSISTYKACPESRTPKYKNYARTEASSRLYYRAQTSIEQERPVFKELPCLVPFTDPFVNTIKYRASRLSSIQ